MATTKDVKRLPSGKLKYRDEIFPGYNKPKRTPNAKKKSAVLAKVGKDVKIVRFGDPNLSIKKDQPSRKRSYCARSGGIKGATNKFSANYWSRRAWDCQMAISRGQMKEQIMKKPMKKAGPKGFQKRPSKTTRSGLTLNEAKSKMNEMSEAMQKRAILQMLQGKTPAFMKKLKQRIAMKKKGLWANIQAKRKRIKAGSGERMRKPGSKGAPTAKNLRDARKTSAKKV